MFLGCLLLASINPACFCFQWYMETANDENDASGSLVALKHKADFHYYSKNYGKAIETYEQCFKLVPPSNSTWRREFMENLSRSYLHLGKADKALEWSLKLVSISIVLLSSFSSWIFNHHIFKCILLN